MIKIGDRVFLDDGDRWAVVVAVSAAYRTKSGQYEPVYGVHFYDRKTGLPMVCPDSRCKGGGACVICGRGKWAEDIKPMNPSETKLMREADLIRD